MWHLSQAVHWILKTLHGVNRAQCLVITGFRGDKPVLYSIKLTFHWWKMFSIGRVIFQDCHNCSRNILVMCLAEPFSSFNKTYCALMTNSYILARCFLTVTDVKLNGQQQTAVRNIIRCRCWIEDSNYGYVLSVPILICTVLNICFLINIIRVLRSKMGGPNVSSQEAGNQMAVARAIFILMPLLGVHNMIISFRPETGTMAENVYQFVSAVLVSFQVRLTS